MFGKYLYNPLLVLLLTFSPLAFARSFQESKSRDVLVKESIANLDSDDIHVAAQAAINLGLLRATEGVPAMLRVLQSSRLLSSSEHIIAKDKNGRSEWVLTDVRAGIITALGLIGDKRAVPVLKKYLKKPLSNDVVFTGTVAHALYQLTGKSYEYKTFEGEQKLYVPSPQMEEEFRKRSRPDLKATDGLTASLDIEGHGHDVTGAYWLGDRALVINLAITNQSKRVIEIDASADNFLFSSVAGERRNTPASLLLSTEAGAKIAVIKPGETLRLRWVVEKLKESPLSRGWAGYVNIKCVYNNPQTNKSGVRWRGKQLISNTVERYYYPPSEQALAADCAIACFSSNLLPLNSDADRAPQLKPSVRRLPLIILLKRKERERCSSSSNDRELILSVLR
jgi:PBS lyase HEAT-like repeat-containing protein